MISRTGIVWCCARPDVVDKRKEEHLYILDFRTALKFTRLTRELSVGRVCADCLAYICSMSAEWFSSDQEQGTPGIL